MVSLSTEICQNLKRVSLPSLFYKERLILIIFFLFLFNAVHRIIFTAILQLLFFKGKLKYVLFPGHKIQVLPVLPHKHLRQELPNSLWVSCIDCLIDKWLYAEGWGSGFIPNPYSIQFSKSNDSATLSQKRKVQWNNSCKAVGFTVSTTDTDSDNIQKNLKMVQCTEPQIVLM